MILLAIMFLTVGGILYRLGGWKPLSWCKHNKILRRIILPLFNACCCLFLSFRPEIVIGAFILQGFALSLPLGDDEPTHVNFFTGLSYCAPALLLSFYGMPGLEINNTLAVLFSFIPVMGFYLLLYFSNDYKTEKFFGWTAVEITMGVLQQLSLLYIIYNIVI